MRQLEEFIEEYKALQKQMADMRSVCDSLRRQAGLRREMSELRNAIADIERRCRMGSSVPATRRRWEEADKIIDGEREELELDRSGCEPVTNSIEATTTELKPILKSRAQE